MDIKILEYIIAIAEEGSLSKAAERFYLSQPVLTKHVKRLEAEYGAPFFIRSAKGMTLTREGILFVNHAQAILHEAAVLEEKLRELRNRTATTLRVILDSSHYNFFLQRVLPAFRKAFPMEKVEITTGNAIQAEQALLNNAADVALMSVTQFYSDTIRYLTLFSDPIHFYVSPGFAGDATAEAVKEALQEGTAFTVMLPAGSSMRMYEEQMLIEAGIFPSVILEAGTFRETYSFTTEGSYCTFFADRFPGDLSGYRRVADVAPLETSMIAAWSVGARPSRALESILNLCAELYAAYPMPLPQK